MLPFWIVAGPRLPRRTERKRRFGVWKEHYQAEPETSARAIHLPNCTAGVSRSVQEEVFHREVARMKTSVLPGRKWSEALTKRKWSTQRVQPSAFRTRVHRHGVFDLSCIHQIHRHVWSFIKVHTFCHCCHTSCINIFESVALMKKDQLLYLPDT